MNNQRKETTMTKHTPDDRRDELSAPHPYYTLLRLVKDYRSLDTTAQKDGRTRSVLDREADLVLYAIEY
jgi:hypothetical protein